MNREFMLKMAEEEHERLYKKDIIYKALVDDYIKASISNNKEEISKSINALHFYKEKLIDDSTLRFVKELNITHEEFKCMLRQGIIGPETMINILKFKWWLSNE